VENGSFSSAGTYIANLKIAAGHVAFPKQANKRRKEK
jgi:hypothetical protein